LYLGYILKILPLYSPDYMPIEESFSCGALILPKCVDTITHSCVSESFSSSSLEMPAGK
jgi:hypothetical protein